MQIFTADVDTDGFPDVAGLAFQVTVRRSTSTAPPCSVDGTLSFTVTGPRPGTVEAKASLPKGWDDGNPSNDTSQAQFTLATDVDAGLSIPATPTRPTDRNTYDVTGSLTLTGDAAHLVQDVDYTVTGGTFAGGGTTITLPAGKTSPKSPASCPASPPRRTCRSPCPCRPSSRTRCWATTLPTRPSCPTTSA